MDVAAAWLHQGFFVLGDAPDNFTRTVREELRRALGLQRGALRIGGYPSRQAWRHTVWWREGDQNFVEAQFFAQIAKDYPVLSLGVSVEKGIEISAASGDEAMDRRSWSWPQFVLHAEAILWREMPAVSAKLGQPVSLRVHVSRQEAEMRTFPFFNGQWHERHKGTIEPSDIASYIAEIDQRETSWVEAYFSRDIGPREAEGLSSVAVAEILLAFNGIRECLQR